MYHGYCYVYSVKCLLNFGKTLLPSVIGRLLINIYQNTGHRRWPQTSHSPTSNQQGYVSNKTFVQRDYIHKIPVILNDKLQNESHKSYLPSYNSHLISSYEVIRRILAPPLVYRNTLINVHINSHTVLTCNFGLHKLVLPAAEFCRIVKLILMYEW